MAVNDDIDAIIARAMAEYNSSHNIEEPASEEATESHPIEPPIIPENSKSVLVETTTSRFSSAIWYDKIKESKIILAGVGGIGSYVFFLLSRMHPKTIIVYDDDVVEGANMSGQLYSRSDIGSYKAAAISSLGYNFSDYSNVLAYSEKFTSECTPGDIMICGFDNMEARKTFFESWLGHVAESTTPENCLFIDGRLAAEQFQVFTIQGNDFRSIQDYRNNWLFSDYQADETICSYKQTSFCANMIASVMVNTFVNFMANMCDPLMPRDVPYLVEYTAETMYFKVVQ